MAPEYDNADRLKHEFGIGLLDESAPDEPARDVPWGEVKEHFARIAYYDEWELGKPRRGPHTPLPEPDNFASAVVTTAGNVRKDDLIVGYIDSWQYDGQAADLDVTIVRKGYGCDARPEWHDKYPHTLTLGVDDIERCLDYIEMWEELDRMLHDEDDLIVVVRTTQN